MGKKQELVILLSKALELEHAARIQYLAHAELVEGIEADSIVARLKEIANDELKHEGLFRQCISILDGEPSMKMAATHYAKGTEKILKTNLKAERDAIDFYRTIYEKLKDAKSELKYEYEFMEHKIRHVIQDEEEHAFELRTLLKE